MPTTILPSLTSQAQRLLDLGVHELAGLSAAELQGFAEQTPPTDGPALLALRPDHAPASALAPLLRYDGKPGFVVSDMTDVDSFAPIETVEPLGAPVYLVTGLDRGDHLANWTPDEALGSFLVEGRTPLLITEGLHWALQQPSILERNHCFMTIGSRLRKATGALDARTPAIWISNGTGRDGRERRNAPKVGWCWAGNRHTWLGFASADARHAGPL